METALVAPADGQTDLKTLNEREQADLLACEETIGRGLQAFVEVGRALQAVRDGRLYRAEFGTFEEYCLRRWQIGRAHANRYIDASAVAGVLSPIGDIPTRESHVRLLTRVRSDDGKLDEKMIVKLWKRALGQANTDVRTGGKQVNAKIVERVVTPVLRRRKWRKRLAAPSSNAPERAPRIAKDAAVPVRMAGGMIPTVTLQLPMKNPQATVGALASNFDRSYIKAVVEGLQRYLETGHAGHIEEPASCGAAPATFGSVAVG
jgi:hypothetical protein